MRVLRGLAGAAAVAVAGWLSLASPALGAFPGANGLLAVQPRAGGGIVLIAPNGHSERRICVKDATCGKPRRPRWSPDGRAIVFAGPRIRIVDPDGSCLSCQFGAAPNPAFKPGGTVISFIEDQAVTLDKIDGNRESAHPPGSATDAVWSAAGALAVVRGGTIWAGRPGRLARLGTGSAPSWSPDGAEIAAAQRGWIVIFTLRAHRVRRLARGSAPAFSPDGRWIAYIGPGHRLMVVRASGAQRVPRRVGDVHGLSVDWQPKPRRPHPGCAAPPGSHVLASSPTAVVTSDGALGPLDFAVGRPLAYMGCLRSDGRERLLERFTSNNVDDAFFVRSAALAAPYAGLVREEFDEHYGGDAETLQVFDLRTGRMQTKLGGEAWDCLGPSLGGSCQGLDQVVLGPDGVSAAHSQTVYPVGSLSHPLGWVSCAPGSTTCVAVETFARVFSTANPTGGAGAWNVAAFSIPAPGPASIECPSSSLCVGAGVNIYTSTDPTGGAAAWTPIALGMTVANEVSCPTQNLCVVTRGNGSLATSTNPAGGASAWSISQLESNRALNAVFCSTHPQCFVADSSGTVFTSANPSGGAGAWAVSANTPPFASGACTTASLCVSVNGQDIQTTLDPGAGAWTKQEVANVLNDVACPSASLCVAVGDGGALYESTNPASGVWAHTTIDGGRRLNSVACPSPALCVAVDSTGHVVTSSDPTGGASAWTPALIDGEACDETTPCSVEQIQVSDANGLRTVDSSRLSGDRPFLTRMKLSGDTLSWSHAGEPRSATLTR